REPRAVLILNRFSRSLKIIFALDLVPSLYDYIQPNYISKTEEYLESAKTYNSITYLRFGYKDLRID
ncbi:hypothetical protein B0T24DRAFT_494648, partial [Lasiosphaeria ovina]